MSSWIEAREEILQRFRHVRQLIEDRDEAAILPLINQQDEFCEEARDHQLSAKPQGESTFCDFCPGLVTSGGCLHLVAKLNHAVLIGDWREAGRITDEYISWVESLDLGR